MTRESGSSSCAARVRPRPRRIALHSGAPLRTNDGPWHNWGLAQSPAETPATTPRTAGSTPMRWRGSVCFGQARIELYRFAGGSQRFLSIILWRSGGIVRQNCMNVGEPGIRQRVGWIFSDCLLKVIDRLLQVFGSPFVPKVAPFHIELVCFRIFRRPRGQHMFRRLGQLGFQPFGDGPSQSRSPRQKHRSICDRRFRPTDACRLQHGSTAH